MIKRVTLIAAMTAMIFATSCSNQTTNKDNPLFGEWKTPFGVPPFDKVKPEHFKPAIEEGIKLENQEIEAIINNTEEPNFENVILAYDNSGQFLSRALTVFSALNSANTTDQLQAIDEEMNPVLSKHGNEISMNPALFQKIKAVYDKRETMGLDKDQMRLLDKIYKSFERSGANLNDDDKTKLKSINEQLSMLTLKFGKNLLADNKAFTMVLDKQEDLVGLPESVIAAAADEAAKRNMASKWVFTLDKPSWIPFLQYSEREDLREQLYKGYLMRGENSNENDTRQIINDIMKCRIEKAHLLGFESFSDFVLDRVMAKNSANVYDLLNQIWTPALERAKVELADMKAIKVKEGKGNDFNSWDWWYYAEKVRKDKYALDEEMLRPYFSLETVRDGIFTLSNKLYGLTFKPIADAPKYHDECQVFEVLDKDGSFLGVQYLDFHPRAGKRGGAWCGSFRPQTYENGVRVAPISTIVCNFTPPTGDTPALLSMDETETFFHEFGHALHGLMSDVKYKGLRGTERDFVELPSQIMENWATAPEFLKMYAKHYKTGEVIPDELIEKINQSTLFNQGFMTVELTAASLIDMDIHTMKEYQPFDVIELQNKKLLTERGLIKEIEPRYRYPYFQHIFSGGYSSGYYSYTWAEVLDADAYQAFVETGDIFNPEVAAAFRENVLSKGGSEEGMVMYRNFRGKDPNREPLLKKRGLL